MPKDLDGVTKNIEKEKENLLIYSKELHTPFPYKDELGRKKERLIEVDGIIVAKAKELDEKQNESASISNETPVTEIKRKI
ncbi:MAG TPA: hypothetical protein VMU83_00280 [Hanamia sp.]|nr:hypothetical protein [Hanamia sp.]